MAVDKAMLKSLRLSTEPKVTKWIKCILSGIAVVVAGVI